MRNDALYCYFPRWLEESGLPAVLAEAAGPQGWMVFKKLIELDSERNALPGWVSVPMADFAAWCGMTEEEARAAMERLMEAGYVQFRPLGESADSDEYAIVTPIETPLSDKEIRERMKKRGWTVKPLRFRYGDAKDEEDAFKRTQNLYHEVFGARMNTHIASDLREIAENFEPYRIREVFEEAKRQRVKSLSWVITNLYRGERQESDGTDRRGSEAFPVAARYELED